MKRLFAIDEKYHGSGRVQFAWQRDGNFLASAGANGLVHIFDRQGEQVDEIGLENSGRVILDWDEEGDHLAVLQENSGTATIWNGSSRWVKSVDIGFKDPSFLKWSKTSNHLAIGTCGGNLVLYCLDTRKKIPVIGKHTATVLCGAWSERGDDSSNVLVLASEDQTITFSNISGETLRQTSLKAKPISVQYPVGLEENARGPRSPGDILNRTGGGRRMRMDIEDEVEDEDVFGMSRDSDDEESSKRSSPSRSRARRTTRLNDSIVSVNLKRESVVLYDTQGKGEPRDMRLPRKNGTIKRYILFREGVAIVGYARGQLSVFAISGEDSSPRSTSERWHETQTIQLFDDQLRDMKYCARLRKLACVGDDSVKIVEYDGRKKWTEVKNEAIRFDNQKEHASSVAWTEDGHILTVSTTNGRVYNFVAAMPIIHDHYQSRMAHMSSLQEVSIFDVNDSQDDGELDDNERPSRYTKRWRFELEVEPEFVALGDRYFAAGMNNRVWYYRFVEAENTWSPCGEKEYLGSVESVKLGVEHVAVICDGRVHLHSINDSVSSGTRQSTMIPDDIDESRRSVVTSVALTDKLLIYSTRGGALKFFSLQDWTALSGCDVKHTCCITKVFPNKQGTRVAFVDVKGNGYVHSASGSSTVSIPDVSSDVKSVHWDQRDWGVFVVATNTSLIPYMLEPLTINGPQINSLGILEVDPSGEVSVNPTETPCPVGFTAVTMYNGVVVGQLKSGAVRRVLLRTHDELNGDAPRGTSNGRGKRSTSLTGMFTQSLALGRFDAAWELAEKINKRQYWLALSTRAMELVDIKNAIRAYRQLGDAGMVLALERLLRVEDKNLLAGHICVLFSDFAQAQELFLRSSNARAALDMRRDLLHWDHALKLAKTLAPSDVSSISVKYAQQLETRGEFSASNRMYESAWEECNTTRDGAAESKSQDRPNRNGGSLGPEEIAMCRAGIARTTLRLGDVRRGRDLALQSGSDALCCECASILESMKQFDEAATLFEKGGNFEKAASIYIAAKKFSRAAPLMAKISSTKLHAQFAKAKKAQKDYKAAAEAYSRARDMDSVVEIYLEHIGEPDKAMEIARQTQSARAAQMVAAHCNTTGNYKGAIEFLLMAKRQSEAFQLAKTCDGMDVYVAILGTDGKPENYVQIARYYEQKKDWANAGHFYSVCGHYQKALKFFLKCGDQCIDKAIALVGDAHSEMLTHTLIDFLMGEADGVPKDPNYIYRLYMAMGNYTQAAKTAIIIARQEQELGNYKFAHQVLYKTQRELRQMKMRVPKNMDQMFRLLHSYLLAKGMVKAKNHVNAAHMLIRVANNISKFPMHTVQILTLCVIECQRAGLKSMAFKYASKLVMTPELREKISEKFKRKIEQIVRKFVKYKDTPVEIESSPSPFATQHMVPVTDLVCPITKNDLPWCVVTGYHMNATDWCICPNSKLPALFSKYKTYIEATSGAALDPVLGKPVRVGDLIIVDDPKREFLSGDVPETKDAESKDEGVVGTKERE